MKEKDSTPGDGIRSVRTTSVFRVVNFELYAKPNKVIMGLGLIALAGSLGYIAYMKHKYEGMGYYISVDEGGQEAFLKKKSRWD